MSTAPADASADSSPRTHRSGFDRYFEISARGSTVGREIRGGLATFFTMAYIVVLNPLILSAGVDGVGGKLPIAPLAAGTALIAGVMTITMGVVARFPLALAAGLGVNAPRVGPPASRATRRTSRAQRVSPRAPGPGWPT